MSLFSKFLGGNRQGSGVGNAQAFIDKLTQDLQLSPDQAEKIRGALGEFFNERREIKQGGGNKDQMRESKQDFKQDILQVLTSDQQQKFMANIQEYKQLLRR